MSNDQLLNKGVFDLRQVLTERQMPEDRVPFYVDEDLGYAAEKLQETLEKLHNNYEVAKLSGADEDVLASAEKAITAAEEKLEELNKGITPYYATLRAITRRQKFDIQSKALHAFPIKRDLYGNDDPEVEFNRRNYMDQLIWATHLKSVQSPDGATQDFNGVDDLEIIIGVMDSIPESAYRAINRGIDKLMDDGTQFEFAAQNEDFSSPS